MYSQPPTDRLIRELIATGREATDEEIEQIISRMAGASFDQGERKVPIRFRGAAYQGRTLGPSAPSLTYHLTKRVVIEEQWAAGTTAAQYVADLRQAVRSPSARLALYTRRGGAIAAAATPTDVVVPPERRGSQPQPQLLVLYSADRGIMISGYQFSILEQTGIPGRQDG